MSYTQGKLEFDEHYCRGMWEAITLGCYFVYEDGYSCLRCSADWPAGESHVCADYLDPRRREEALRGEPVVKVSEMFTSSQATLICPACGRPAPKEGEESEGDDSPFVDVVQEFLKVNHLQSAQEKVERLGKVFRFVRRS